MAIKTAVQTTSASTWNFRKFFPQGNYVARVKEASFGLSKADNPMITLGWEIVNAEPKSVGDEILDFNGVEFKTYHVTKKPGDEEASQKAFNAVDDLLKKAGYDTSSGWDDENPPVDVLKGVVFHVMLTGKSNPMFEPPTAEDRAAGKKQGKPITNPITGKEELTYQINLQQIYGKFDGEVKQVF